MSTRAMAAMLPTEGEVVESRKAKRLIWAGWTAAIAALLLIKVSGAANTQSARSAVDVGWLVVPLATLVLAVLALVLALRLVRTHPLGRSQPIGHLRPHLIAALSYAAINLALVRSLAAAVDPAGNQDSLGTQIMGGLLSYAMWTAVAHGVDYVRRYRGSALRTLRLRAELAEIGRRQAEAELRALKSELNPHFLRRAFESAAALVHTDPDAAERVLIKLTDVMRAALSRAATPEVPLQEEIDEVAPFLAVERAGSGAGVAVDWQIEESARDAFVPHLLLQPLLETVIKHTAAVGGTALRVTAARDAAAGDRLNLLVESPDGLRDAVPITPESLSSFANIQARLRQLYGSSASLELETRRDGGLAARLGMPWRGEDASAESSGAVAPPPGQTSGTLSRRFHVFLAVWFATLGTLGAAYAMHDALPNGQHAPLLGALLEGFVAAALTTAMIYVAVRITRGATLRSTWYRHGLAALSFGATNAVSKVAFVALFGEPYPVVPPQRLVAGAIGGALIFVIVAAIAHATEYARRYRESKAAELLMAEELAEAGRRRAQAELRALKLELNPHFLGNALAAAATLVHVDPTGAERMLAQLGETLHTAIAHIGTQEVTLGQEIDGLAPFLAVERARFGDQLAVNWDVEEGAFAARIPHMILQPLIENAVKHGIGPRGTGGCIVVSGRRTSGGLEVCVRDDGIGLRSNDRPKTDRPGGVGLANARARLEELYGSAATLELESAPESGTVARLTLPLR